MNSKKDIGIVKVGDSRVFVASLNFGGLPDDKKITWKNKAYTSEEAGQNPFRVLYNVEDDGNVIESGSNLFISYQFSKDDSGKYVKFYSYVEDFSVFDQFEVFYVEEDADTSVEIKNVGLAQQKDVYVGDKIKLRVEYSVDDEKVPPHVRSNVKWMVRLDGVEERLIIDGLVVTGGTPEIRVPESWHGKTVLLMPYLSEYTEEVSLSLAPCGYAIEIGILTSLDDGEKNEENKEKDNENDNKGMVYGRSYQFEALFSTEAEVPDSAINWEYSYYNEPTDSTVVKTASGRKIKIKVDDVEMLGQDMEVLVYVGEKNITNALYHSIKVWTHNRFRWLKQKDVRTAVDNRKRSPQLIDQADSSLCGIAVATYFFAGAEPEAYDKAVMSILKRGQAVIEKTGYKIKIDSDEHLVDYKQGDIQFDPADFLMLAVLRDQMNILWDYDPRKDQSKPQKFIEGSVGITFPHMVVEVIKNLLGWTEIHDLTNLATSKWSSVKNSVEDLDRKLSEGYKIAMLINTDDIFKYDKPFLTFPNHWVALESIRHSGGKVIMRVFTWGGFATYTPPDDCFKDGYFGYIMCK